MVLLNSSKGVDNGMCAHFARGGNGDTVEGVPRGKGATSKGMKRDQRLAGDVGPMGTVT